MGGYFNISHKNQVSTLAGRIEGQDLEISELEEEVEAYAHKERGFIDEISDLRGSVLQLRAENDKLRNLNEVGNTLREKLQKSCNEQGFKIDKLYDIYEIETTDLKKEIEVRDESITKLKGMCNKSTLKKVEAKKRVEELEYKVQALEQYSKSQESFDSHKLIDAETERDIALHDLAQLKLKLRELLGLM